MQSEMKLAKRLGRVMLVGAALGMVAGCGSLKNLTQPSSKRVLFEGLYYPARLSPNRDDRKAFTVTVNRAAQGIEGAREAGRYEATRYCIEIYGRSDATWTVGPDTEGLAVVDDQLILAGRCKG